MKVLRTLVKEYDCVILLKANRTPFPFSKAIKILSSQILKKNDRKKRYHDNSRIGAKKDLPLSMIPQFRTSSDNSGLSSFKIDASSKILFL